jgi:hypothetical protein
MRTLTMIYDDIADQLDPYEFVVYSVIKRFSGPDGTAYPSIKTIAERAKISQRKVCDVIKYLSTNGYLAIENRTKKHGGNNSNVYLFNEGEK